MYDSMFLQRVNEGHYFYYLFHLANCLYAGHGCQSNNEALQVDTYWQTIPLAENLPCCIKTPSPLSQVFHKFTIILLNSQPQQTHLFTSSNHLQLERYISIPSESKSDLYLLN